MPNKTVITEVLDIIYTHEKGQISSAIKLDRLPKWIWESKDSFERFLNQNYEFYYTFYPTTIPINEIAEIKTPKLFKISTCVYSDNHDFLPDWYNDKSWTGKFYYS